MLKRRHEFDAILSWGRLATLLPLLPFRELPKIQRYCRGGVPWGSVAKAVQLGGDSVCFVGSSTSVYSGRPDTSPRGGEWKTIFDGVELEKYLFVESVPEDAPLYPHMRVDDGRALPNLMTQAILGEPLTIYGDGSHTRSFCYVSDLVEGVYRLLLAPNTGPLIVNLGNPDEVTVQQLAAEILELTGSQSEITFRPLPEDDPKVRRPDIRRAKEILGWQPVVPRDEGLRKTLPYFKEALAQLHVADRERKRLQLQAMG